MELMFVLLTEFCSALWSFKAPRRVLRPAGRPNQVPPSSLPAGSGAETFRFGYGPGDQLERIVRDATGPVQGSATVMPAYGRDVPGGVEFRFPAGTPPGTVSGPFPPPVRKEGG